MAIEKRGADTYRIGFQTLNADGTYKWVRETFHATPGLSEAYQRMEAEVALERLKLQAQRQRTARKLPKRSRTSSPSARSRNAGWKSTSAPTAHR